MAYAALDGPLAGSVDAPALGARGRWRRFPAQVAAYCLVELQKLRHDQTELFTRAAQPVLWLVIYGEVFTRVHAIPTGHVPYLTYLAPGIVAQSSLFVAIFYGVQVIAERDAGILAKLLVTPTPRAALVAGKGFSAGLRAVVQVVVVMLLSVVLGVRFTSNPLHILAALVIAMLGAAFFSCVSMTLAGLVMKRERLMGLGQMIMMPLFFGSSALYPLSIMPGWLQALTRLNPLTYEVNALRDVLINQPSDLLLDFGVLVGALVVGVTVASSLIGRLTR